MEFFVEHNSVVRQIWGKGDTILFIFGGASAEFALNKAVDWLYFTGKLPADPLRRLFSTVTYAREIIFSEMNKAYNAIDKISAIHSAVEASRGATIPDWAYRDVLFMLIHYSIASFELLERKLKPNEKDEVFNVFYRMGKRMGLKDLPENYASWLPVRQSHLEADLEKTTYTVDLYKQYKKHLGSFRYWLLVEGQKLVVPPLVRRLLGLRQISLLTPILFAYKISRALKLDNTIKYAILPQEYKKEIRDLDVATN